MTTPKKNPIITLTTDFGADGIFVASMKGVILGINPKVNLIDVTHAIPSYDIEEAAFLVKSFYQDFPSCSIHIVVVDPGVGSPRKPLLIQTRHGYFVGPDNGVFTHILRSEKPKVWTIHQEKFLRVSLGQTFHGRDLFAPVAARLSRGEKPGRLGSIMKTPVMIPTKEPLLVSPKRVCGEVVYVDKFGNLITNISLSYMKTLGWEKNLQNLTVKVSGRDLGGLHQFYSESSKGKGRALINSFGDLEIFCNQGNAQKKLGLKKGASVEVWMS